MFNVECSECDYKDDLESFYSYTEVETEAFEGTQYITVYFVCPDCGEEIKLN
jgi:hypothetical protein